MKDAVSRMICIAVILTLLEYMEEYRKWELRIKFWGSNSDMIKEEQSEKDTKVKYKTTKTIKCTY